MNRNIYTGATTFDKDEMDVVTLAIDARCEQTLSLYRSVSNRVTEYFTKDSTNAARDYFGKEYLKACKLYKELLGTDYPATTSEGDVPGMPET